MLACWFLVVAKRIVLFVVNRSWSVRVACPWVEDTIGRKCSLDFNKGRKYGHGSYDYLNGSFKTTLTPPIVPVTALRT